jgi:hypothetical protein
MKNFKHYHIDTNLLDFGVINLGQESSLDLLLVNDGSVPIFYSIQPVRWPDKITSDHILIDKDVSPIIPVAEIKDDVFIVNLANGKLNSKEKIKIKVKFSPKGPEIYLAFLDFSIENYGKKTVTLYGKCYFPRFIWI